MIGKRKHIFKVLFFLIFVYICYVLFKQDAFDVLKFRNVSEIVFNNVSKTSIPNEFNGERSTNVFENIVVAIVACDERLEETLTMIKSCLLFSPKVPLKFVVVAEDKLIEGFTKTLNEWRQILNGSFQFEIVKLKFPANNSDEWHYLFKPCASQRLFFPSLLPHIDSLIYLDTDTLFLSPVKSLWKHFNEFNASHIAALALEHDDPNVSWYSRFAKHPYYGKLGVNSGVMLMNLTRMRLFHWEDYVNSVYRQWRTELLWGDQDIINIIFHYHSDKLLLLNCDANFRSDQCTYGHSCNNAVQRGARVLHGSRSIFHNTKQPAFAAVYKAVEGYQLGTDPTKYFLRPLLNFLTTMPQSNCGQVLSAFIKIPQKKFGNTSFINDSFN